MNNLKKWLLALLVAVSVIGVTTACTNNEDESEEPNTEENQDAEAEENTEETDGTEEEDQ